MLKLKDNDDGFTLIELLVTVAIIGIVSVVSWNGISKAQSMSTRAGLMALSSAMDATRYESMARADTDIKCVITKDNGKTVLNVMSGSEILTSYPIVDEKYDITLKLVDDAGNEQTFENATGITIGYNKGDGSLELFNCNTNGTPLEVTSPDRIELYFGSDEKHLTLSPLTGRGIIE